MTFVSRDRAEPGDWPTLATALSPDIPDPVEAGENGRGMGPTLNWDEVGFFLNAIATAPRQWRIATLAIRQEFALNPRGPWILGLIHSGRVVFPSNLAKIFECSPGLITGEVNRLVEAGLVETRKHEPDGRQLELTLTPLGETVNERLGKALVGMVRDRLAGYSRDEVMLCSRLLRDFATTLSAR